MDDPISDTINLKTKTVPFTVGVLCNESKFTRPRVFLNSSYSTESCPPLLALFSSTPTSQVGTLPERVDFTRKLNKITKSVRKRVKRSVTLKTKKDWLIYTTPEYPDETATPGIYNVKEIDNSTNVSAWGSWL